ncbi:MAG: hypothetical protein WCD55_02650 [Bacteroidales bacterium]
MTTIRLNIISGLITLVLMAGCEKELPKINYKTGFFPDSVIAIEGLNTQYDDYNMALEASIISNQRPVVFASNRQSSGGEFDLIHGVILYTFGQTTGTFSLEGGMKPDSFLDELTSAFNTAGNEYGPFRFFNTYNGKEYMVAATEVTGYGLDLVYTGYMPVYSPVPSVPDPVPATVFNSDYNDAYLSLNSTLDTAYFCSDRSGNFDIYMMVRPPTTGLDEWFTSAPAVPVKVDSLCGDYNDKCPFVFGKYMFFTSDRPGGDPGEDFDLYYSVFKGGKWNSPVNLGPAVNTPSNEYRPVIGIDLYFDNVFMIFSSDRPGGKGGFDLYFTGFYLPGS